MVSLIGSYIGLEPRTALGEEYLMEVAHPKRNCSRRHSHRSGLLSSKETENNILLFA